jgi:hypothetical protein
VPHSDRLLFGEERQTCIRAFRANRSLQLSVRRSRTIIEIIVVRIVRSQVYHNTIQLKLRSIERGSISGDVVRGSRLSGLKSMYDGTKSRWQVPPGS